MDVENEILSRNLQRMMDKFGKTRYDVCDDLKIGYTTFSGWLQGKNYPRMKQLQLLADYFHVTINDLALDKVAETSVPEITKDDVLRWINDEASFSELADILSIIARKFGK